MIYVEMAGRCGNQMFHYACARAIQIALNDQTLILNFDNVFKKNDPQWRDYLLDFNTVPYKYYEKKGSVLINETNILQKLLCGLKGMQIKAFATQSRQCRANRAQFMQSILNFTGVYWIREGVNYVKPYSRKKTIVSGICESPIVFSNIRDELINEFTPKKSVLKENQNLLNFIDKENSICVSVRRGDFFEKQNSKSFAVCTPQYYLEARNVIENKIENPYFIVFSDDIEWCKEHLWNDKRVVYVSQNMPVYETLRLMYHCKHFIVSNSTFSWWGQFLSKYEHKIVISPSKWNNDGYDSPLIDKSWILLDTN